MISNKRTASVGSMGLDGSPDPSSRIEGNQTNIFVVGLDAFNRRKLDALNANGAYAFHPLLTIQDVTSRKDYNLDATLAKAEAILGSSGDTVHGIIGYWDFPVSLIIPILSRKFHLCSPSLESVLKCEHKYWSRLEQRRVAPDHVPAFQSLDPFDETAVREVGLDFPFWIKPVKSFSSHLGFRVHNPREYRVAIQAIRGGIREIGNAFNQFLRHARLPEEVNEVDGNHCIIERLVSGHQCTLEGFVHQGEVEIYGVVDSFRCANRSTFARYQYPSTLPGAIKQRMADVGKRVIARIGLDDSAFNIEFFWERRYDRIWLLEINPRISQSHGDLFEKVDGTPHHQILVQLALRRKPLWTRRAGEFRCAAKFFLRAFRDAQVTRVPTDQEIRAIVSRFPGTLVEISVSEGMRLSDLEPQEQDSYSYIYGMVFVGAQSAVELRHRFAACQRMLRFEFTG